MEKMKTHKRPAASKRIAKSKLKVFDFDFSDSDSAENQPEPSPKAKVQSSKLEVTTAKKNEQHAKLKRNQSEKPGKTAKPRAGTLHVDDSKNSSTKPSNTQLSRPQKSKDPPQNSRGALPSAQITESSSSSNSQSTADQIFTVGQNTVKRDRSSSAQTVPNTSENTAVSQNPLTAVHSHSQVHESAKKPTTDLSSRNHQPSKSSTTILSSATAETPAVNVAKRTNIRRAKRVQPRASLLDDGNGQAKTIKRVKTESESVDVEIFERSSEDARDVSSKKEIKSRPVISEIATRTRSNSKTSVSAMSPLDEMLESPVEEVGHVQYTLYMYELYCTAVL